MCAWITVQPNRLCYSQTWQACESCFSMGTTGTNRVVSG